LAFLHPRAVDDLRSITGVPKIKLHQLVEVLKCDDTFQPFGVTPTQVKRRLDLLHMQSMDASEKRDKAETLYKLAMKLSLPKFNGQLDQWPTWTKQVTNGLRKYGLESWLSCIDVDNHRHSEIDQSIHAALYEAVNTRTI